MTTQHSDDSPAVLRCVVGRCGRPSVGVLVYKPKGWGTPNEQPLCSEHSDPAFHLRPLSTPENPTYWTWRQAKHSGRTGAPNHD